METTPNCYRKEQPRQEELTLHTVDDIGVSPTHDKVFLEGLHNYQNHIIKQDFVVYPKHKAPTEGVRSTSANKLCLKPTFNVSIKRYSKVNVFSRRNKLQAVNGTTPEERRKNLNRNKVHTVESEKLDSQENHTDNVILTGTEPDKNLSDLFNCSNTSNIKSLKEDCHLIENVFLTCNGRNQNSKMNNLNILDKLYQLVSCGAGMNWKQAERFVRYVTHYLCNNPFLVSQLVYIMTDSEDLEICLYATKILHHLLHIKCGRFDKDDRSAMESTLSCPTILKTLVESMHFIDTRFLSDGKYKQELEGLHSQILQIILMVCKTDPSEEKLRQASDDTVKLIGKLTSTCSSNKDLANSLLETLKIMCVREKNCKTWSSRKFINGLCKCCNLTNNLVVFGEVLESMSRNESALDCMTKNENIMNLIMDLIEHNEKNSISNRVFYTTLYRIIETVNGFRIFSKNEMYDKLYQHFLKKEKHSHRFETIEAYTILNRVTNPKILQTKFNLILRLPEDVKRCMERQKLSQRSYYKTDKDDDDSDQCNTSKSYGVKKSSLKHTQQEEKHLADMCPFYIEHLLSAGKTQYPTLYNFDIYKDILSLSDTKLIENRVQRGINMNRLAYPDAVMLDPEFDQHTPLVSSTRSFSIKKLDHKLKLLKGIVSNTYSPRVVYDLDQLQRNHEQPVEVPHPDTYSCDPNKLDEPSPISTDSLKFESRFECGNLRKVIQIEQFEYELWLTPDTNTNRGMLWFYFQVTNMTPRVYYTFNITNCLKLGSQYNCGMQPLMFSVTDYALHKTGWKRVGREIVYYGNNYINQTDSKQHKTLTFSIMFQYSNDYVYFAYHYPYTYTRLMVKLFPLINHETKQVYARIDKLCPTVSKKNEIAMVTITGAWNRAGSLGIPLIRRPLIFITARAHPGETNASWIMEGIIKFLLHETNANAVTAREHFIFKIIPMLNPEGVIYGNNRRGLTGEDFNRSWFKPSKITCPEIYNAKRLIACAKKVLQLPIAAFIDIHGHSQKKFFFIYGCNPAMSWNKKDQARGDFSEILKLLPEMIHNINPNIALNECKYEVTKEREGTGRIVMWRDLDIKHSFTLECSLSFANEVQSMNTQILTKIGASVIASLGKIADKAYTDKKVISSLSLDYSSITKVWTKSR